MAIELKDGQKEAVRNMKNGSLLCGGVGSGKSITALAYYMFNVCQGSIRINDDSLSTKCEYKPMLFPHDLYIITTAKKRDSLEWDKECARFSLSLDQKISHSGVKVTIDSWNNIQKYSKVCGAFFIFDEQRVVGSGAWVKTFLNISRKNKWVLLSATPGDQWSDYIPVFVANGFYKNKTEFNSKHCVFSYYAKYPKIERYINEKTLREYRDSILVDIPDERDSLRVSIPVKVGWDRDLYKTVNKNRWDPYDDCPIQETGKLVYLLRRVVNSDPTRLVAVREIYYDRKRCIIFYNYTYELDILRTFCSDNCIEYTEWNGQKHEELPNSDRWIYLVQYTAGCEGWNCITSNTVIFYSQSYSYRMTEQAAGRIDRVNTPYKKLYYYYLCSSAPIDLAIRRCLKNKKNFNERSFIL